MTAATIEEQQTPAVTCDVLWCDANSHLPNVVMHFAEVDGFTEGGKTFTTMLVRYDGPHGVTGKSTVRVWVDADGCRVALMDLTPRDARRTAEALAVRDPDDRLASALAQAAAILDNQPSAGTAVVALPHLFADFVALLGEYGVTPKYRDGEHETAVKALLATTVYQLGGAVNVDLETHAVFSELQFLTSAIGGGDSILKFIEAVTALSVEAGFNLGQEANPSR